MQRGDVKRKPQQDNTGTEKKQEMMQSAAPIANKRKRSQNITKEQMIAIGTGNPSTSGTIISYEHRSLDETKITAKSPWKTCDHSNSYDNTETTMRYEKRRSPPP